MNPSLFCVDCSAALKGRGHPQRCKGCAARHNYFKKYGRPPERKIMKCGTCEKEFTDYACSRKKSSSGEYFCSVECRREWVRVANSVRLGGDGIPKNKKEKDAIYYRANGDKIREHSTKSYKKNRDAILSRLRQRNRDLKMEVMSSLGGKCECCGELIIQFLTVDHINGGGAEQRRRCSRSQWKIYNEIKTEGYPRDKYRVLCFNCNIALGAFGECPHRPGITQHFDRRPMNPGRKRIVV